MALEVVVFFSMLLSGLIDTLLGAFVHKPERGFWLGTFLGPLGWIILFLLPLRNKHKNQKRREKERSPMRSMRRRWRRFVERM